MNILLRPLSTSARSDVRSIVLRRVGAYVLDIALLFTVLAPLGYIVQRTIGVSPVTAQDVYAALVLNFSVPAWAYFAAVKVSMTLRLGPALNWSGRHPQPRLR